jgi:hypothetical protein
MSPTKNFDVAAKSAATKQERVMVPYSIGDDEQVAWLPSDEQVILLMASMGEDSNGADVMSAAFTFLKGTHDEESYRYIRSRFADPDDPFEADTLTDIAFWLVEEKAARPTRPSGGSSQSPGNTGSSSTASARRAASTRSRSTPDASAT